MGQNGLKMGSMHLLERPQWSRIISGKRISEAFDPFLVLARLWPTPGAGWEATWSTGEGIADVYWRIYKY